MWGRVQKSSLEARVSRLESQWRRIKPALEFYELMSEKGLREDLPKILEAYQRNDAVRDYLTGRRRLTRSRWVIALAVFGAGVPIANLVLQVVNSLRGH